MFDLNTLRSITLQDLLILFLLRYMCKKDVARGLSVTPSSITQRLEKIAKYLDISMDKDGRINYATFKIARDIICHARETKLLLREVKQRVRERREKEARRKHGFVVECE